MSVSICVPTLGESVLEGTVARWLVAEGDYVEVDQIIVELTTDKIDVEIPAPSAGRVDAILVAVDAVVEVGAELLRIDPDAERPAASSAGASSPSGVAAGASAPIPPVPLQSPASPPTVASPTPLARRAAEQANIDVGSVSGSGHAGRVTRDDVIRHRESAEVAKAVQPAPQSIAAAPAPQSPPAVPAARPTPSAAYGQGLMPGDEVVPMSRLRKLVADHMVYSKRTSPHVGTVAEIDMSDVVRCRARNKDRFKESYGFSLTFLPFIVHAVVSALKENMVLNASVIEDSIVMRKAINIGIAVETEKGLMVPVVRDADRLSLSGLAAAIDDLSTRARNKKLSADDLRGGTFTISNPGRKGNLYGFAIINQPQVGILRMGEMVKRPVVRSMGGEDAIVIRSMMHLALSYDHRAVDGSPANAFLFRIRELLEAADFDL